MKLYKNLTDLHATKVSRIALFKYASCIPPFDTLSPVAHELMHRVAHELGRKYSDVSEPGTFSEVELRRATWYAKAYVKKCGKVYSSSKFCLCEQMKLWPPFREDAAADVAEHTRIHTDVIARLSLLAGGAWSSATRAGLAMVICVAPVARRDEKDARDWRLREFLKQAQNTVVDVVTKYQRLACCTAVARFESSDVPPQLSYALRKILKSCYGGVPAVDFEAFKGASRLPCLEKLLVGRLRRSGRVVVSEAAVSVPGLPRMAAGVNCVSLSADGVLCAVDRRGGKVNRLFVHHLVTGQRAMLRIPHAAWARAHDGTVYAGVFNKSYVLFASLDAVFGQHPADAFRGFAAPAPIFHAAIGGANNAQVVVQVGWHSNVLAVLDLTTRAFTTVRCERKMSMIGSQLGTHATDALCVARECGRSNATFAVFPNGRMYKIARRTQGIAVLLPSTTAPEDLSRAAVMDGAASHLDHNKCNHFKPPAQPESRSLVRLYQDVFLCIDKNARTWRVMRIAVP
eukprot:gnl/Chilomastix_cuspidata/6015.p1 GENE.gnl/Chilomastix_cuspidata/6015~~gnl/Chilomastix_cuspidata/6015.p1  ORF type:complete len:595 (+),score=149.13 gnl/Chilomastix_cuspidata/6015:244-1785(+)